MENVKEVKYIAETKTFVVDGKIISENSLTAAQVAEYKKMAESWKLLLGITESVGSPICG